MTYDLVGTVYVKTGTMLVDDEGNEYPETMAVDGYHVNILDAPMEIVEPYIVQVNSPSVVFAGRTDAIFLKFTDRAEWLSLGLEIIEEEV